jgi:G3E family GTPase
MSAFSTTTTTNKIPVTILTGFLGSGKTTFVNYLLREHHGLRIAIIENEFGEVSIDDGLVLQTNEEIVEMLNGCICCTVRDDLIVALKRLVATKGGLFDAIVIETTGLADPAPVAQTFFVDDTIKDLFVLDGIVTFVDAKHLTEHLEEVKPEGVENEAVEQIAFADVLVINKTDLVTRDEIDTLKAKLQAINHSARVVEALNSRVPVDQVIGIQAFSLEKVLSFDDSFLDTEGEHMHDKSVTSVGIVIEGEFFGHKLNAWIQQLLTTKGTDIFRSKGIIAILGEDEKFVFQGVHMLFRMGSSSELGMAHANWRQDEKRINKLCFIGKNLNREELVDGLKAAIFNGVFPDPGPVPTQVLRFPVGATVMVNVGEWEKAVIVKHWYREDLWDTGHYAPYQAALLSDPTHLIYVPKCHKAYIRPCKK